MPHPAQFWHPLPDGRIFCYLCSQFCRIPTGEVGFCRYRRHDPEGLVSLNYGQISSYALDPIEKKPLYHFYPGSSIFSIGSVGCSLACQFCQNWGIAQAEAETISVAPSRIIELAGSETARRQGCIGIAYTYNEPIIWSEYIRDVAPQARAQGLKNVLVTSGYATPKPWRELMKVIDAANIDVKGYTDRFYDSVCSGHLAPVRKAVEMAVEAGVHVEITTLLIPDANDSEDEIESLARWLASLNPLIPLHFSRYFPNYHMQAPPTPLATLQRAQAIAKEHLRYVYLGNVGGGQKTHCPECGEIIVERDHGVELHLDHGRCPRCHTLVAGFVTA
ncbi:MAG: AmmeMemoRadiSam system radical SAM enzyme [Bacillota bacterium]